MKRLLWPICIILIAIVLFSVGGDKEPADPETLSVSEAAFAVRTSEREDATGFLVGRFQGDQGTRLNFDGSGVAEKTAVNLDMETGTYSLTQAVGGTALLQISFGGERLVYTFCLEGENGEFRLTDTDGNYEVFNPIVPGF